MTDDPQSPAAPQQEAVWYFPPKKNSSWKVWLISGLAAIALAIVVVFLVFVLPNGLQPEGTPSPTASASGSPSSTPTPTTTPTPTATPTPTPTPTPEPTVEPTEPSAPEPPAPDPDLDAFAGQVQPRLDDGATGLQYAAESGGEQAATDIGFLRADAEVLSDTPPPSSIAADWSNSVSNYLTALDNLQNAYRGGSDLAGAQSAASSALQTLRDLVGL